MAGFKVLGTTNDVTDCDCCGKTGLKMTVILGRLDADGNVEDVLHFGRDCAALATKIRRSGPAMEAYARNIQAEAEKAERNRVHEVGTERSVVTWVVESVGCNGGSITTLCYANGLLSLVKPWAEARFQNAQVMVRKAR